jgi:hypothetical protein
MRERIKGLAAIPRFDRFLDGYDDLEWPNKTAEAMPMGNAIMVPMAANCWLPRTLTITSPPQARNIIPCQSVGRAFRVC